MLIKVMGLSLFLVGLVMILLATFEIFGLFRVLGSIEQWVVFASGTLLCVIGFLMARNEEELTIESRNNPDAVDWARAITWDGTVPASFRLTVTSKRRIRDCEGFRSLHEDNNES